jgi:hypothetical protein
MGRTAIKHQIERYEAADASAALIVLADPRRYPGGLQEWAEMVAHRLATTNSQGYPELTQVWARLASQRAFHEPDPWRNQTSEADLDELADLMAWNRR